MAKEPRKQNDISKLIKLLFSSKGMKVSDKVRKDISDLVEKELGKGKGKPMAEGGLTKMPMTTKNGKKVPAYAADGVGKMNKGGMAKKKPAAKMMAGGMAKKKPAAKMMGGGMSKSSGYMYGGIAKKKPAAKKK